MPNRPSTLQTVALTLVASVIIVFALIIVVVRNGVLPANADAEPGRLETWMAKSSLHATLAREANGLKSPLALDDSTLAHGVRLYGAYCVTCHGSSDAKASAIAKGLYQHAPQFADHDVTDDPIGVTYWKITHGIRLTGMPAFSSTLTDTQRWQISSFLLRQDSLPPGAQAAWKALPSAVEHVE